MPRVGKTKYPYTAAGMAAAKAAKKKAKKKVARKKAASGTGTGKTGGSRDPRAVAKARKKAIARMRKARS